MLQKENETFDSCKIWNEINSEFENKRVELEKYRQSKLKICEVPTSKKKLE